MSIRTILISRSDNPAVLAWETIGSSDLKTNGINFSVVARISPMRWPASASIPSRISSRGLRSGLRDLSPSSIILIHGLNSAGGFI